MFKLIFKILKKKNKLHSPSLSNSEWCPQGKLGHFEYKEFVMAAMKWLIGKDPDAGKDWRQEEKGTTEDEMVEWHHQVEGHEFEQALACWTGKPGVL